MLSIGRTSSYAISALSRLAQLDKPWVFVSDLVSATGAPGPYLAKLLHKLAKAGLIRTKRGYKGGYCLARSAKDISVLEIIEAVEGPDSMGECLLGQELCGDDRACPTHEFWKVERQNIRDLLAGLTLESVADFERRREEGSLQVEPPESAKAATSARTRPRPDRSNGRKADRKTGQRAGRRG